MVELSKVTKTTASAAGSAASKIGGWLTHPGLTNALTVGTLAATAANSLFHTSKAGAEVKKFRAK